MTAEHVTPPHGADDALAGSPEVIAALGEATAVAPPPVLRALLLDGVRARPPARLSQRAVSTPVEAYVHQVEVLSELLGSVPAGAWSRPVAPYAWSVHGLVAHLVQVERYMARVLGWSTDARDPAEADHLQLGTVEIGAELARSPHDTVGAWRAATDVHRARLASSELAGPVVFHQFPMDARTLLVVRAFELWTHADDIRRALGRPVAGPATADVVRMSDTSVRSLPLAVHVVTADVPDGAARVVLTGDGGGVWDLELGRGGPHLVTVVADVVDYCRVASQRLAPDDLDHAVEGDPTVARHLLAAAGILAF